LHAKTRQALEESFHNFGERKEGGTGDYSVTEVPNTKRELETDYPRYVRTRAPAGSAEHALTLVSSFLTPEIVAVILAQVTTAVEMKNTLAVSIKEECAG
jgi:hypothetical protein